ncbi:MAG TPA: hypothetical protein DEH25_11865 [Chloroflexi bacterium]|nr:hypothetical protein [Chloroflexota bacterium]HBY08563.1 hypothetical protein [Chloroflexota bacterium]
MRKMFLIVVLLSAFLFPLSVAAQSETETLTLRLSRDWGYGAGSQIQGKFSLRVSAPDDLVKVDFLIDGEVVSTVTEAPFRYQFNTDEYAPGIHTLTAVGYKADGTPVYGTEFVRQILSAEEASSSTMKIIVPLLVVFGVIAVVGVLGPVLMNRGKEFKPKQYGSAGGAVCPRCEFPYSRNFMAPNMLVGKLQRCPHCGKWAIVPRASQAALKAAEARWEREGTSSVATPSEDEKVKQMIDDSRFE